MRTFFILVLPTAVGGLLVGTVDFLSPYSSPVAILAIAVGVALGGMYTRAVWRPGTVVFGIGAAAADHGQRPSSTVIAITAATTA